MGQTGISPVILTSLPLLPTTHLLANALGKVRSCSALCRAPIGGKDRGCAAHGSSLPVSVTSEGTGTQGGAELGWAALQCRSEGKEDRLLTVLVFLSRARLGSLWEQRWVPGCSAVSCVCKTTHLKKLLQEEGDL